LENSAKQAEKRCNGAARNWLGAGGADAGTRSSRYEPSARAFKCNRCKLACPERQGIDANPVVKFFGSVRRGVAMNDNGTEIA
jgi:hypothetical protein